MAKTHKNSTSAGPLVFFVPVLMVTLLCRRPDAGYGSGSSGSSSSGCGQELSALLWLVWEAFGLGPQMSQNLPKSTKTIQKHPKTIVFWASMASISFWYCKCFCTGWMSMNILSRQSHNVWTMEGKRWVPFEFLYDVCQIFWIFSVSFA